MWAHCNIPLFFILYVERKMDHENMTDVYIQKKTVEIYLIHRFILWGFSCLLLKYYPILVSARSVTRACSNKASRVNSTCSYCSQQKVRVFQRIPLCVNVSSWKCLIIPIISMAILYSLMFQIKSIFVLFKTGPNWEVSLEKWKRKEIDWKNTVWKKKLVSL